MIELLVTESGHRLGIGRMHRGGIDRFAAEHPEPVPPVRTAAELGIEVFGGFEEDELVPQWDDPDYLESVSLYNLTFWNARLENIAEAITALSDPTPQEALEIDGLREIGTQLDHVNLLRLIYLKSEIDAVQAVLAVRYNSTVTIQGIREAARRYRVMWRKKPVPIDIPPDSPLQTNREFSDRRTARYTGYNWDDFCRFTGPEQSALAAFHWLDVRISNIQHHAARRSGGKTRGRKR